MALHLIWPVHNFVRFFGENLIFPGTTKARIFKLGVYVNNGLYHGLRVGLMPPILPLICPFLSFLSFKPNLCQELCKLGSSNLIYIIDRLGVLTLVFFFFIFGMLTLKICVSFLRNYSTFQ